MRRVSPQGMKSGTQISAAPKGHPTDLRRFLSVSILTIRVNPCSFFQGRQDGTEECKWEQTAQFLASRRNPKGGNAFEVNVMFKLSDIQFVILLQGQPNIGACAEKTSQAQRCICSDRSFSL